MRKTWVMVIGFLSVAVLLINVGCTSHQVKPVPQLIEPAMALKTDISSTVAVRAEARTPDEKLIVCDSYARDYWSNTNDLTDAAVVVIKDALAKSNVNVSDDGDKSLTVSVIDARCDITDRFVYVEHKEFIKLKVQTGDGAAKEFEGTQAGGHDSVTPYNVEMGITYAVLAALKDPDIISYLKN